MKVNLKSIAIIFIACTTLLSAAIKLPASGNMLPADTAVMVNVENCKAFQTSIENSNMVKLFNDPAMKPFFDKIKNSIEKMVSEEQELEFLVSIIKDPGNLPQGRATLAIVMGESALPNEDAGAIAILQFGENLEKAKSSIEKLVSKAIEEGTTRKKENIAGVEVTSLIMERDGDTSDSAATQRCPFTLNYCFIEDALLISADTKTEAMGFVISQAKGGSSDACLAKNQDFISSMQAVKIDDSVQAYVNIKKLLNKAASADPSGQSLMMMDMFGIGNISSLSYQLGADKDSGNIAGKILLKINGPKKGIVKILEPENGNVVIPKFVSKDVSAVSVINWDIKKAFEQLSNIVSAIQPQAAMMLNSPLAMSPDGSTPITVKDGLIAHFGNQMVITQSFDETRANGPQEMVFALSVNNSNKLEESLATLHNMFIAMGNPELKREFMGSNIYLIDTAGMMGVPQMTGAQDPTMTAPQLPRIGLTVTDSHLIIAAEQDIEKTLRLLKDTKAEKLESEKWFQMARTKMPSTVGMASFENTRKAYKVLWKMFKEKGFAAFAPTAGADEFKEFNKYVDFSVLPEFKTVEKYFGAGTSYLVSREDGFYIEFKSIDLPK